jgi:ABC-type nitrate/sulfonate/bicarbonate transport system substrate-binding protein
MHDRQAGTRQRWRSALTWCGIAAALAAVAMLAAGPSPVMAQQKTTIRVVYIPVITWLPALVAKDDGIFEKHGLDVQFTKAATIVNLPAALGKQFDLVPTTAPDLLNAAANGLNIAAVAGETIEDSAHKSYQVLVRADSPIKSYKDLTGKRVLGPGVGSVMHVALLYAVKKQGGDPSKVTGLEAPFPAMADQLKAGRVDAVEQLEPFVGVMLAQGYRSIGAPLLEVADPVLFPFWIADADWARAHRDLLKKWVAALQDGLKVVENEESRARAILAKYSGLPQKIVDRIPLPAYDFNITPAQLAVWQKVMVEQGYPVGKLDLDKIVVTGE